MRFYSIVIGAGARRRAVFFRVYSPKRELTRHAGFAVLFQRGTYDKVKKKIFLFDRAVDCFAWDGYLFIRNVNNFQRIFDYFEELRAKAAETIDAVAARVPIANLAEFRTACTNQVYMMSKLAVIAKKLYLARVTMDDIKRAIHEFDVKVQIVTEDGREKLVFEADPRNDG